MINPNPAKIEDLLKSSVQYHVPKYQRQYTWGKAEALEFLDDLKNFASEGSQGSLFLGTIIFDISEERNGIIKVVDGQQRITTILLLLIVCRELAKKINSIQFAQVIQEKITFIARTGESRGPRLITSESIRDVFSYISNFDWDGNFPSRITGIDGRRTRWQVNRLKPIYDFFQRELEDFDYTKLTMFIDAVYDAYVVRIDIEDELEAFSIFERTNARGVDLEASDLLKNYLFQAGIEGLDEAWSQIIENSEGTILRMLKYFYVSKRGYVNKSNLYRAIKIYATEIGPTNLVKDLDEFSRFYSMIKSGKIDDFKEYLDLIGCLSITKDAERSQRMFASIEGLRLFKVTQVYPLIYSIIKSFVKNGHAESSDDAKKLVDIIEKLEKYHFINNAICERIGNEVEKLYADYCKEFSVTEEFINVIKRLSKTLSEKLALKEEFVSRFSDLSYTSESIPLISYIFDRINNYRVSPASWIKVFNPDAKVSRKAHNIEHIFPQNPTSEMTVSTDILESIDNIGNLLVISFRTNSSLGNLSPKEKIEKLENELFPQIQNLDYVRNFISEYKDSAGNWDKDTIAKRAKKIADGAYSEVWKF